MKQEDPLEGMIFLPEKRKEVIEEEAKEEVKLEEKQPVAEVPKAEEPKQEVIKEEPKQDPQVVVDDLTSRLLNYPKVKKQVFGESEDINDISDFLAKKANLIGVKAGNWIEKKQRVANAINEALNSLNSDNELTAQQKDGLAQITPDVLEQKMKESQNKFISEHEAEYKKAQEKRKAEIARKTAESKKRMDEEEAKKLAAQQENKSKEKPQQENKPKEKPQEEKKLEEKPVEIKKEVKEEPKKEAKEDIKPEAKPEVKKNVEEVINIDPKKKEKAELRKKVMLDQIKATEEVIATIKQDIIIWEGIKNQDPSVSNAYKAMDNVANYYGKLRESIEAMVPGMPMNKEQVANIYMLEMINDNSKSIDDKSKQSIEKLLYTCNYDYDKVLQAVTKQAFYVKGLDIVQKRINNSQWSHDQFFITSKYLGKYAEDMTSKLRNNAQRISDEQFAKELASKIGPDFGEKCTQVKKVAMDEEQHLYHSLGKLQIKVYQKEKPEETNFFSMNSSLTAFNALENLLGGIDKLRMRAFTVDSNQTTRAELASMYILAHLEDKASAIGRDDKTYWELLSEDQHNAPLLCEQVQKSDEFFSIIHDENKMKSMFEQGSFLMKAEELKEKNNKLLADLESKMLELADKELAEKKVGKEQKPEEKKAEIKAEEPKKEVKEEIKINDNQPAKGKEEIKINDNKPANDKEEIKIEDKQAEEVKEEIKIDKHKPVVNEEMKEVPQNVIEPKAHVNNNPVNRIAEDQMKPFYDEVFRLEGRLKDSENEKQTNTKTYKFFKGTFLAAHMYAKSPRVEDLGVMLGDLAHKADLYLSDHSKDKPGLFKTCGKARKERLKACARIKVMKDLFDKGIAYDSKEGRKAMLACKLVCAKGLDKGFDGFKSLCKDRAIMDAVNVMRADSIFDKIAEKAVSNDKDYDNIIKTSGSKYLAAFTKTAAKIAKLENANQKKQQGLDKKSSFVIK